ncbi:MAG TPA: hypothetical protein VKD90_23620 [Gemmataceae bacterium]|nr:hypothetical protein [Gemmataceae bacterium]
MTRTPDRPTADEILMVQYQEDLFQGIADRFGMPLAEVGVMAATFLSGLSSRELAEIRRAARRGYLRWSAESEATAEVGAS